jgi:hypothetical protein
MTSGFRRTRQFTLIALVIVLVAAMVLSYARRQLQIDRCLDSGGRWDYANDVCER